MSDTNTPLGTDLNTAQNAIRAMIAPEEETVTEPDALEADAAEEFADEAEMPEEDLQEYDEGELGGDEEAEELNDTSFDLLSAEVEVDGEVTTVEELKRDRLRQRDYTRKTQELAEARREFAQQVD